MPGRDPDKTGSREIAGFVAGRKIDAVCIADVSTIRAPPGRRPCDILPSCRTIILLGARMPDRLFSGTDTEQAGEAKLLADTLESAASGLCDLIGAGGASAEAIAPSLPLRIEGGKLRGRISLKHCAADAGFGTIGDNTLLIHPVFGNRLALAAVITDLVIEPTPVQPVRGECLHCNRCTAACREGAIHQGAVDSTLCRNLTDYVPGPLQSLTWHLMRGNLSSRLGTVLLNRAAPLLTFRPTCTACVTACPYFHKGKR